jgi:hypothetical protein
MAQSYSWTAAYDRALAETDAAQLHTRVLEAEDAMMARSMEISRDDKSPATVAELDAMHKATDGLLKIKSEKLGWNLT